MIDSNIIEKCIENGANKASLIDVFDISFDESLRGYCEANYCGSYGKNYACPPGVGDVEAVISKAKSYKKALVFQSVHNLVDSYDFEGMAQAAKKHEKIAGKIALDIKEVCSDYLQLTAGSCTVCSKCAQEDNKPCRFPDKAVSSLEAYCINVAMLAKTCNMNYINGQNTVTYFGAFFI